MTTPLDLPLSASEQEDGSYGKQVQAALRHLRTTAYDSEDLLQFLAFAMPRARHSKAQLFQDLWALWENGGKSGGWFVEFGAADGVFLSNTYYLEKEMGWSGILAEPNPVFAESLRDNRSCVVSDRCVYSCSGESVEFLATRTGELSRIASISADDLHEHKRTKTGKTISVETISLNDLLLEHRAPPAIDFLSLDTEGSELEILRHFDFERWNVRAIAVEHNKSKYRGEIFNLLSSKGYQRKWMALSRFDDWYVRTARG